MEKQNYLSQLASLLEVDISELTDDFLLNNSQLWDSLSIISTIASIDNHYHVSVTGDDIYQCSTVGDIFKLIERRRALINAKTAAGN